MDKKQSRLAMGIYDIALIGMMTAVIEVSKLALSFLPNIELVSFWIIMFTLFFGRKIIYAIMAFLLIEIAIYGIQTWNIMYLYVWPLLALTAYLCRKKDSVWFYSILSGFFGLLFGAFCSLPYLAIGSAGGGIRGGIIMAFNWWVAGIPYDIVHGIANAVLMFTLYRRVRALLERVTLPHHSI